MPVTKQPRYISPDDWLDALNNEHKILVFALLNQWMKIDTKLYLKISYNTLFIYRLGPVCYFNLDKKGIYVGFYWGKEITECVELFETDERKMIKIIRLEENTVQLEEEALLAIFLNALDVDEGRYGKMENLEFTIN